MTMAHAETTQVAILIVDDKEENLYYLEALLRGHGLTVESARHGAEALVKARQHAPDVVISDLLMPVMDGYTLLRHWKADARLKRVPFIVYTRLRSKGIRHNRSGGPLLFGDLYRRGLARAVLAATGLGFTSVLVGILTASAEIAAVGGAAIGLAGIAAAGNLAIGPRLAVSPPDTTEAQSVPITSRKEAS